MSVYVDTLVQYTEGAVQTAARAVSRRNGHRWCHMIADTTDELHALASRIGLKRAWFQGDHYDLTPGRRAAALAAGALALERRPFVEKLLAFRKASGVATPSSATSSTPASSPASSWTRQPRRGSAHRSS